MSEGDSKIEKEENDIIIGNITGITDKIKRYKKIVQIGEGGFGTCYKVLGLDDNNEEFAIKILSKQLIKEKNNEKSVNDVRNIQKKLNHPNICRLYEAFEDNNNVYAVLELCQNGDLSNLLKKRGKLKEIEVQYYIKNLIEALIYIHERNIVHLDLKLANILLTDKMELKLGDFGLANYIDKINYKRAGTTLYMAPEALKNNQYGKKNDIWAVGVIMYYLIIGKLPFYDTDAGVLKKKIINLDYEFPKDAIISNAAKDLIHQILVPPENRPSLKYIKKHDFFNLGKIPSKIPKIFLKCVPSINYIRNFMKDANNNGIVNREVIHKNLKEEEDRDIEKEKKEEEERIAKIRELKNGPIYVTNYYDHSKKYGLGYKLNNDFYGACFNDSSKILYNDEEDYFFYTEKLDNSKEIKQYKCYLNKNNSLNHDKHKKYQLLKNFIKEITKKTDDNSIIESISKNEKNNGEARNNIEEEIKYYENAYVKRYRMYDKYSVLFQFSNNDIQILFNNDKNENYENIIISVYKNEIIHMVYNDYKNDYDILTYTQQSIYDDKNPEFQKKIKYVNHLLDKMKAETRNYS